VRILAADAAGVHDEVMNKFRVQRRDDGPPGRKRELKAQLPPPYNGDLSEVLHGLKDPNDPMVAAFLYAGVRLLVRQIGPAGDVTRPAQSFLSQRAVVTWMKRNPPPFPAYGSVALLRQHWEPHANYIADVFRIVLWGWHYPAPKAAEMADVIWQILHGQDPVPAIHELCYWDMARHLATPMFRLSLIAIAEADTNPAVYDAVAKHNLENAVRWRELYEVFLATRRLRLRDGFRIDDCVTLLSATADGLAMRALTESGPATQPDGAAGFPGPGSPVLDHRNRRSLLGAAVLAIIASCTEPEDGAEGPSLDQAAGVILEQ
jgi:hypothetical protein